MTQSKLPLIALIIGVFTWVQITHAKALIEDIKYPTVAPQVSFKSITELPVKQPDLKISYGTDPLQYGWLWLPKKPTKPTPLVVMVHGGCWLNAFGVEHTFPMATALAQAGHPVWSLEYRRTGDTGGGWPGSFNDIQNALSQIKPLMPESVDTSEVVLIGHSAGGHLAILAAANAPETTFKNVIGLAAITDISRYALGKNSCQQATSQFMAGLPNERPDAYFKANLIYQNPPKNLILFQGDADQIVPVLQSELGTVTTEQLLGAGHFDWIHPGSPAFQMLLLLIQK